MEMPIDWRADIQIRPYNSIGGFTLPLPVSVNLLGTKTPPRQAELDTPPQEGNWLVQNPHDHPVRLRLPLSAGGELPLHRRGIGWYRTHTTTPSGCAAECRGSAIAVVYLY